MTTDSKPAGRKPDYNVYASGASEHSPNYKIGSGWKVSKDGISITLIANPVDGKVVLFPVKEQETE